MNDNNDFKKWDYIYRLVSLKCLCITKYKSQLSKTVSSCHVYQILECVTWGMGKRNTFCVFLTFVPNKKMGTLTKIISLQYSNTKTTELKLNNKKNQSHANAKPLAPFILRQSLEFDVIIGLQRFQKGCAQLWAARIINLLLQTAWLIDLELIQRRGESKGATESLFLTEKNMMKDKHEPWTREVMFLLSSVKVKNISCNTTDETLLPFLLTILLYIAINILIFFKTRDLTAKL